MSVVTAAFVMSVLGGIALFGDLLWWIYDEWTRP